MQQEDSLNIVIGGEAGQGVATVGYLLAKSLVRSGYSIVVTQSYYSRIRGGHNTFAIRFNSSEVAAPCESIDYLIALDTRSLTEDREALSPNGLVLADEALTESNDGIYSIPTKDLGASKYANIAILGVTAALLDLDLQTVSQIVEKQFGKKDPKIGEANREALIQAYHWQKEQGKTSPFPVAKAVESSPHLMIHGNEAIVLGALSAGVKFCSYYPMTPATSIITNMTAYAADMGVIIEQAEDEIAAVNMAIGASFAGVPSLVPTSGGGFALMVESVSLAGITETPVVIVIAQRPGPATGMATRTEQGDLEMVLHAGHGDFPRCIFAPGSLEECFHLTRKAFELAERYQGPVFLMTDQFLADSYRAADPFDIENLSPVRCGVDPASITAPYRRYALTDNGISPRLLPGMSEHLVVADSHEHTEAGHITEDTSVRKQMVEKRAKKEEALRQETTPPEFIGDENPSILLVSWGSTKGSAIEAAAQLSAKGRSAAALHFSQVWPLVPEQFLARLESAEQVICVEGNATAQFTRLIRRETGFHIPKRILRYDGRVITPESILRELES